MKYVTVDVSNLVALRNTINNISVKGVEDCGRVLGIIQMIDNLLDKGEEDGDTHTESGS